MRQGFVCILVLCLLAFTMFHASQIPSASARDPQLRNWIDVEVSYLSSDGIVLKITFETTGNYLNQDVVIRKVLYGDMVTVTVDRAVIPAYYSVDTNTTVFQYILPDGSYSLPSSGSFPSDSWRVTSSFLRILPHRLIPIHGFVQLRLLIISVNILLPVANGTFTLCKLM